MVEDLGAAGVLGGLGLSAEVPVGGPGAKVDERDMVLGEKHVLGQTRRGKINAHHSRWLELDSTREERTGH